jgi:P63C domain
MATKYPKAAHSGKLRLGKWEVDSHVLDDGRRLITQAAFLEVMDFRGRGNDRGHRMTHFLDAPELKYLNLSKLIADIKNPIIFAPQSGGIAYGYEGSLVVDYCDALLKAKRQGLIDGELIDRYCFAAEGIVLSVAKVGIVALIDEATGFQEIRPRQALQAILDKYLRDHGAKWAKRFPDEFYVEMFRLKRWDWKGMAVNRPSVVGHYTNDLIYMRLAPAILEELQKRNPIDVGKRKQKHHQWLTDDVGHPKLEQHLHTILAFMKVAKDWGSLCRMVDKAFPKIGHSLLLDLDEDFTE